MTAGNNRKENTFKKKQVEPEIENPLPVIVEDTNVKKDKKEKPSKEKKTSKESKPQKEKKEAGRLQKIIGILFLCLAVFLGIALISYLVSFFSGHHQEYGYQIFSQKVNIENRTGSSGVFLAQTLIKESFGIGSFFFVYLLTIIGLRLFDTTKINMWSVWKYALLSLIWMPLLFGFLSGEKCGFSNCAIFGGAVGLWLNNLLETYTGWVGVLLILIFLFLVFAVYQFNLTLNYFRELREKREDERRHQAALIAEQRIKEQIERENNFKTGGDEDTDHNFNDDEDEGANLPPVTSFTKDTSFEIVTQNDNTDQMHKDNVLIHPKDEPDKQEISLEPYVTATNDSKPQDYVIQKPENESEKVELVIENTPAEETVEKGKDVERHTIDTPFDPRYELKDYKFPTLDMLNDYGGKKSEINSEELEANKNKIVETLANYGIAIDKIKATIGPTVTLYEIVPAAGIRISKIKNLEDDIALSLAALGIRIIAPIPGKGTIGIEVPNSKPETVSMRSVLSSEKFQNSKYALPCAIGKTISNETYVFDLAKMPHILMAGATGQGKSVGLNAIIASLLYCKHPSELKFVMVDPKKVELTLYNRIERHYLAKLPDSEDAIITDVKKVVRTLNSLCIEMDQRYDLLKAAECRNIIEYNEKFKSRRLLPTEGHRFLPYIVLVVDEFADLIMTAGREVEAPIARIAQLARAVGIHLIIATQRPSVNIITGSIKANFPARIAFRVISQVDSKTILDQSGANQLIGRGDMLLSTGNDLVRLQCAFIDTPEVEAVTEFIGNQRGFAEPFLLPEVPEEEGEGADIEDDGERDSLFEEAAHIVVQTQQGSTSMIQRKLKLGYNRAGRIIDQLEAAGIVGPFSGSKSREVKVTSEAALEQILRDIYNKDNGI
ncbi:MAG: DNA translocase FtsK 4TM domain-containing protein [Bacteroidales bacterium]|nr:DNA translocase FtsK 4TM domain-containing protein [Bacteroidales bacterium]